jgi:4-amino-4-deoxy-L-arabinose transferase-like glycosyltransferase
MEFIKKYSWYLLLVITLLGFSLRFLWLDLAPRGLLIDEAHFGYIANSLLETGRDEHGISYPLVFKGFGDNKLPAYGYLLVPFIKLIGLNSIAIRLPSAIYGSLFIIAIFLLLKELKFNEELSLWGALIAALNPWSFMLSRFAFESNLALLIFVFGLIFLLKSSSKWQWGLLGTLLMASTWYVYVAYRPVTVLVGLSYLLFLLFKKKLRYRYFVAYVLLFVVLIAPLFNPAIANTGEARLKQIGIFFDKGIVLDINEKRTFCTTYLPKYYCYALWNKPLEISKRLVQRFVGVYSPQFLSTQGEASSGSRYLTVESFGQFYLLVYIFIVLGLVGVLFNVEGLKITALHRWLVWSGLLFSPLPAILAGDPQKVRLSPLLPFLIILAVFGIKILYEFFESAPYKQLFNTASLLIIFFASILFFTNYFSIHVIKHDNVYGSYLPKLFSKLEQYAGTDQKVAIKPFFSDPIMAYAYYQKVPPQHYQENVVLDKRESSGFQHAVELDNYFVTDDPMINVGCLAVKENTPTLYVTNEWFREQSFVDRISSETGAIYYAYIYDAFEYAKAHPEMCL